MTTPTITTLKELVEDQCDEFTMSGKPFSAVAVTEALKAKELKNPNSGVDIRHRDVNELVRGYMSSVWSSPYIVSLTQPKVDIHGKGINAPDGVYVYHLPGYDANDYKHPSLTKPLSKQGMPTVFGFNTSAVPPPIPVASVLPLVNVRYTFTDDNPKNEDTHIFRATFSKKEATEKDVYDVIIKKIEEKILDPQGVGFEKQDENEDYVVLDEYEELYIPIVIYLKYNDENDKTQEKTFVSLDEFDKEYGFQRWLELQEQSDEDEDESDLGNLVSTLPTSSRRNLPHLHLPIYNDGRVGIPSGIVKDLDKDAIVLRVGDVPGTVKFIKLQDYLSENDLGFI